MNEKDKVKTIEERWFDEYLNQIDLITEVKVLIKQHLDRYEKEIDSISYIFKTITWKVKIICLKIYFCSLILYIHIINQKNPIKYTLLTGEFVCKWVWPE